MVVLKELFTLVSATFSSNMERKRFLHENAGKKVLSSVVTESYQDDVLMAMMDLKAVLTRAKFLPSDQNHSAVGVWKDAN